MDLKARLYEVPKVTIITLVPHNHLLITSNEGLGYEDLFSPVSNAFPHDEDFIAIIP